MLPPLYDEQRKSLSRLAAMLVLGSGAILPVVAHESFVARADVAAVNVGVVPLAVPGPLIFPGYSLRRDPFTPDAADTGAEREPVGSLSRSAFDLVLPPNAGADGSEPHGAVAVRAIVIGAHAKALIDIDGNVNVLGVGDRVAGARIASVSAAGIRLDDGTLLPLQKR